MWTEWVRDFTLISCAALSARRVFTRIDVRVLVRGDGLNSYPCSLTYLVVHLNILMYFVWYTTVGMSDDGLQKDASEDPTRFLPQ